MCTVSWRCHGSGYELYFNRDERRTRAAGIPPTAQRTDSTSYLAPRDGDALGTWLAVNEYGLTVGLLNGFPAADGRSTSAARPETAYVSRGHLPPALIDSRDVDDVVKLLQNLGLDDFRPFMVLAVAADGRSVIGHWSGVTLEVERERGTPARPLVSSSFCNEDVRRTRLEVFERLVVDDDLTDAVGSTIRHRAYHASHLPARGAHSVCMHRPDARTVSFSQVVVGPTAVELIYTADSPCRGTPGAPVALPRQPARAG